MVVGQGDVSWAWPSMSPFVEILHCVCCCDGSGRSKCRETVRHPPVIRPFASSFAPRHEPEGSLSFVIQAVAEASASGCLSLRQNENLHIRRATEISNATQKPSRARATPSGLFADTWTVFVAYPQCITNTRCLFLLRSFNY